MSRSKHCGRRVHHMARYDKECTTAKRITMREWRHRCSHLMRAGRYDELPRKRGTQGWITY